MRHCTSAILSDPVLATIFSELKFAFVFYIEKRFLDLCSDYASIAKTVLAVDKPALLFWLL